MDIAVRAARKTLEGLLRGPRARVVGPEARFIEMFSFLLRASASAIVCLALFACSKDADAPRRAARIAHCPGCNVILISMDTVRADHVSAYGHPRPTTPNVDALAAKSVLFENAVSQSSWTLPAHGSMMTGLYPGRLGVSHYPAKRRLPDVATIAETFRRAGYATAGFTGGGFVSRHFGFHRGFDTYTSDGRRFEHNLDETLAWIEQNRDRRFFLFVHGYDAHRPYFSYPTDKRAMGIQTRGSSEKRGFCVRGRRERPEQTELASILAFYDASIHMGDRAVGSLLTSVAEHGLMDDTVILVTSDHGEEFFEHGNCDHVRFLYKEIVNVPYVLYVPGLTPDGERVPDVVPASISVARTLLELVGVENDMPGVSLVPVLEGKTQLFGAVYSEADSVLGVLGSRGATIAMTGDQYKLISYVEEGTDEAYDLISDPREQEILPPVHEAYARRPTLRAWYASNDTLARPAAVAAFDVPAPRSAAASVSHGDYEDPSHAYDTDAAAAGRALDARREKLERHKAAGAAERRDERSRRRALAAAEEPAPERREPPPSPRADEDSELELPDDLQEQLRSLGYLE